MSHDIHETTIIERAIGRPGRALPSTHVTSIQQKESENPSLEESRRLINQVVDGLKEKGVATYAHMCYGYANAVLNKSVNPEFYASLELMASTNIDGVSIEYAQPGHTSDVLHALGNKVVILGCINCAPEAPVETADEVAARLREALTVVPASRLHASTDCGLWFLPRDRARAKLAALVEGTRQVRRELGLHPDRIQP